MTGSPWVSHPIVMNFSGDMIEWSSPRGSVSFSSLGVEMSPQRDCRWPHCAGQVIPWKEVLSVDLLLPVVGVKRAWIYDLSSVVHQIPFEEWPDEFRVTVHVRTHDHSHSLGGVLEGTKKTTFRFVQELSSGFNGDESCMWAKGSQLMAAEEKWRDSPAWRRWLLRRGTANSALRHVGMVIAN